jgi:hypothetical protein
MLLILKISPICLWYFFKVFVFIFPFNIRLLGLQFCDFFCFLFYEVILISYSESHVNWVNFDDSSFFHYFLIGFCLVSPFIIQFAKELAFIVFFFFCMGLSWPHKWVRSLACWLKSSFFFYFLKLIFFQFFL